MHTNNTKQAVGAFTRVVLAFIAMVISFLPAEAGEVACPDLTIYKVEKVQYQAIFCSTWVPATASWSKPEQMFLPEPAKNVFLGQLFQVSVTTGADGNVTSWVSYDQHCSKIGAEVLATKTAKKKKADRALYSVIVMAELEKVQDKINGVSTPN